METQMHAYTEESNEAHIVNTSQEALLLTSVLTGSQAVKLWSERHIETETERHKDRLQ